MITVRSAIFADIFACIFFAHHAQRFAKKCFFARFLSLGLRATCVLSSLPHFRKIQSSSFQKRHLLSCN